jgi:hypothetical protein
LPPFFFGRTDFQQPFACDLILPHCSLLSGIIMVANGFELLGSLSQFTPFLRHLFPQQVELLVGVVRFFHRHPLETIPRNPNRAQSAHDQRVIFNPLVACHHLTRQLDRLFGAFPRCP